MLISLICRLCKGIEGSESSHLPILGLRGKIVAVREMLEERFLSSNFLTEISHLEVPLSLNQAAASLQEYR
jgi:hypothetical protein